jgi:hypothetical protein
MVSWLRIAILELAPVLAHAALESMLVYFIAMANWCTHKEHSDAWLRGNSTYSVNQNDANDKTPKSKKTQSQRRKKNVKKQRNKSEEMTYIAFFDHSRPLTATK